MSTETIGDDGVRIGAHDCVASVAEETGFFWETLWKHPKNATLKKQRQDPYALLEGDHLFVPPIREREVTAPVDRVHRFKRRGVPEKLSVEFQDPAGEPRAAVDYQVSYGDVLVEGTTDDEGRVEIWIPPRLERVTIRLLDPDDGTPVDEMDVNLGLMPPIDTPAGVAARLTNIGCMAPGQDLLDALCQFQVERELEVTGELDDATRAGLLEAAG